MRHYYTLLRHYFALGSVVKLDSWKCDSLISVIPAKAGIQKRCRPVSFFLLEILDSGPVSEYGVTFFSRNDGAI